MYVHLESSRYTCHNHSYYESQPEAVAEVSIANVVRV